MNEQPLPVKGNQDVTEALINFIRQRQAKGIETYGRSLETNNGRDAMRDLLEELLDGAQYLIQAMLERDERERIIADLQEKIQRL